MLAEVPAGLAAGRELRELLERFLDPIVRLSKAQGGTVRMLSPSGDQFELVGSLGLSPVLPEGERYVHDSCGFCGAAADQARVVWSTDLDACARHGFGACFGPDCSGALTVPLQHKGRVLGVCNLFFASGTEPEPVVADLLRSVGELLGLALDNLRLEAENVRATVMQERQRMAGEVHDAVAQNLTFIKLRLPLLHDAIRDQNQVNARAYLEDVRETLGEAHASLREIITQFRTRSDPRGLGSALESLATRFCVRTGIPLQMNNRMPHLQLAAHDEAEVFHVVQEALANVEHHANARHGWLSVEPTLAGAEFRVEDDGVGAQPSSPGKDHHGIEIMHERAARLGAELSLAARPGGGTVVRLALPIARSHGEEP